MSRSHSGEQENLNRFVAVRGGLAIAGVPVSGTDVGGAEGDPVYRVDAVWFATGEAGRVVPWEDMETARFAGLLAANPAFLVSPRGYADRTAFGMLICCRELLSRAFPQHHLLRAIALTEKMSRRSIVYLSEGIQVTQPDGTPPRPARNVGPRLRGKPDESSAEDTLVERYYTDSLEARGTLWQEVPVSDAALDGLYVPTRPGSLGWWSDTRAEGLATVLAEFDVDVIEAKRSMNMDVIGQSIAGASVLAHTFPRHRLISQTVLVGGTPDPCLDWVCHKRGIAVTRFAA